MSSKKRSAVQLTAKQVQEALAPYVQALEASSQEMTFKLEELNYDRVDSKAKEALVNLPDLTSQRQILLVLARLDPFCKRILHITCQFTHGEGLTRPVVRTSAESSKEARRRQKTEGQSPAEKKAQNVITRFWDANKRSLFGLIGQYQRQADLLYVGDIFLNFQLNSEGVYQVRPMNWREMKQIIPDEDDYLAEKWYRREWTPVKYDPQSGGWMPGTKQIAHYPSLEGKYAEDSAQAMPDSIQNQWIHHIAFNRLEQELFGRPVAECLIGWFEARKSIAEDTATLFRSLSRLAWHEKIGGGRRAMDSARAAIDSAAGGAMRVPPSPASAYVSTEGRNLEAFQKPKIGGDAWDCIRIMMNAISSGSDLSEHYFGNAADSNLATATALEYPILKAFQWWRRFWTEVYDTIFQFQLAEAGIEGMTVDVDFPPLGAREVDKYVASVISSEQNSLLPREEAAKAIMQALTLEDLDYGMQLLEDQWEKEDQAIKAPLPIGSSTPLNKQQPKPDAEPNPTQATA